MTDRHSGTAYRSQVLLAVVLVAAGSLGTQLSSALAAGFFSGDSAVMSPAQASSIRFLIAGIVFCVALRPRLTGRNWGSILIFAIAVACMNIFLYEAIERLPLGVAVTLDFLGPCAVALFYSRRIWEALCALAALGGVALISIGPTGYFDLAGYVFGIAGAVCFGMYTVFAATIAKPSPTGESSTHESGTDLSALALTVAVAGILTLPLSVPGLIKLGSTHLAGGLSTEQWTGAAIGLGMLALSALLGVVLPYVTDTLAGTATSARVIGVLFALDPVFGAIIGYLWLGQVLSLQAIGGIVLVIIAGSMLVWISAD